jgi:glycosyltransferase involved in cell wall biosynthesis
MSGCVVVATDVGGTTEISDKDDLILIPSGNIDALHTALLDAIKDYDILHDLSRASVTKYFDWQERIKPYYSYYL